MKIFKKNLQSLKLILGVAAIVSFFISCTKTKTETITIQKTETAPISAAFFLNGYYFFQVSQSTTAEEGLLFSVAKNGKILRLGTKMPKAGSYRVTLWDTATKTQLSQATVNQASDGVLTFSPISPVSVITGKTYLVSIWASGYVFEIYPMNNGNVIYPIISGNITITGFRWITTTQNPITYPTNLQSAVTGLPDIEFKAD
jgi:hypothetical protein